MDGTIIKLMSQADDERHHRELEVMHAVVNDPMAGVECAKDLGAGIDLFNRHDMRIMWAACERAAKLGRDLVERLTLTVLRDEGLIGANGRGYNGIWTPDLLSRFFQHFASSPAGDVQRITLSLLVPRLIEIHKAQREATEYIRHACNLLERGAA